MKTSKCFGIAAALCVALPAFAQYKAQQTGDSVRLEDAKTGTVVSIHPGMNNQAYEMKVKGQDVLNSIPFLAPWGNRLDEMAFYANGTKYPLNMGLGNLRAQAMHGFLAGSDKWVVKEVKADDKAAWETAELEFYKEPAYMAQFPFAHTLRMTYRLSGGALEVHLQIHNLSNQPMPVSIGFHPAFKLHELTRDQWTINVPARVHYILDKDKIPTGETEPIEKIFPNPRGQLLKGYVLDDVFGDLIRDSSGRAAFVLQAKTQKIEVVLGPNFKGLVLAGRGPAPDGVAPVAAAPAPASALAPGAPGAAPAPAGGPGRGGDTNALNIEPMVAITNAMNMAQKGTYKELQSVAPGGIWEESFWIRPSGF